MRAKTFPAGSEQKILESIERNKGAFFYNQKIMNFAQKLHEEGEENSSRKHVALGEKIYNTVTNSAYMHYKISGDPSRNIWINAGQNLETILNENKRITLSGEAGSGKGTLTKFLKDWLGYEVWSMGDMRRSVAEKHGLTIQELNEIGKENFWTDKETDDFQKELGKNQNLIVDGRLSWYFMDSLKIYVDAEFETRVDRIHKDPNRYSELGEKTYNQVWNDTKERKTKDLGRYRQYYGINPFDQNHYDLILDTTKKSPEDVFKKIVEKISPENNSPKLHT